jgi:hypothetical protein
LISYLWIDPSESSKHSIAISCTEVCIRQFSGFIEKEGMRTFSFDGRTAKDPAAVAAKTVAGRNAPAAAAAAPKQAGGFNPFGFLGSTTLNKASPSGTEKENQV